MEGPWEKYQSQDGPWQKYAPQEKAEPKLTDNLSAMLQSEFTKGSGNPFAAGVVGRFASGMLGLPMQTVENAINLSRAGGGMLAAAMGRPDLMPSADVQLPGNVASARRALGALGLITENPLPDDPGFKAAEIGGGMAPAYALPGASVGQTGLATAGAIIGNKVAGPEGEMVGAMVPAAVSAAYGGLRGDALAKRQEANAQRDATAATARSEGYKLPPSETNPSLTNRALEGWAGKLTTRQVISAENSEVSTAIAKRSIGLKPNDALTEGTLHQVRETAGQAYEAIKSLPSPFKTDGRLRADIQSLDSTVSQAAKAYPGLVRNPGIDKLKVEISKVPEHEPAALVELIKDLRFQAKENYKGSFAAQKPAQQVALADAQKKAADMLENFIERSLSRTGQQGLVKDFRDARTTIARTYDVEAALNEPAGTVNARVFANLMDKGRPLGGGLEVIGRTYKAFEKAMQRPEAIGSQPGISPLDVGAAAITASAGKPEMALTMLGRPLVRSLITSGPYQNAMGTPNYAPMLQPDSALAALLRGNIAGNMTQ